MNIIEVNKLALSSIWANKLRSFLTLLGVIFGVATVIVVVSLIEGFNGYVDDKIANIGTNAFRIQKFAIEDFASIQSYNQARKRNKDIDMDDLMALRNSGGSILTAGAKTYEQGDIKYENETIYEVSIAATTANIIDIDRLDITQGRYYTEAEVERSQYVCFLGTDVADKLFPTTSAVGKTIKIDSRPFKVLGVAKPLGSVFGQSRDKYVSIPITTFLGIYGSRRSLLVSVIATNPQTYQTAIDEARVLMRTRRKLTPDANDNFGLITPSAINNLRDRIFGTIQVAAVGVTSIALVVGGIVIMNIMLVSVTERTREIGIRKAIGARRRDIIKQFITESAMLALLGGIIGILIAALISRAVALFTPIPTVLPLTTVFLALGVSGSIGIISGVYPAWRAAKLDPIIALRTE